MYIVGYHLSTDVNTCVCLIQANIYIYIFLLRGIRQNKVKRKGEKNRLLNISCFVDLALTLCNCFHSYKQN